MASLLKSGVSAVEAKVANKMLHRGRKYSPSTLGVSLSQCGCGLKGGTEREGGAGQRAGFSMPRAAYGERTAGALRPGVDRTNPCVVCNGTRKF